MTEQTRDQLQMQGIDPLHGKRFLVRKRDGRIEEFNEARILLALESAFMAHEGIGSDDLLPDSAQAAAKHCADKVVDRALARALRGEDLEVELIQDMVENQLMLEGHLEVVRRYILYREKRRLARVQREEIEKLRALNKENSDATTFSFGSASPQLKSIYRQALPRHRGEEEFEGVYRRHLDGCINECEYWRFLAPDLLDFDSNRLARGLRLERDQHFTAGRLESLRERYLLKQDGRCLETPQYFWMRVAIGLALNEADPRERRALEFYEAISSFRFIPSDLILSRAGTRQPCLADAGSDDAADSLIEPWHRYITGSLEGKKLWVPDLFMKRVREQGSWTLFDPDETGDLRDLFGSEFEKRYVAYEQKADRGAMRFAKRVKALDFWHETLAWISLTGQPCLGFKDAVILRSQQPDYESSQGPVGAINLAAHVSESEGSLDVGLLRATVNTAVRMLDNAVDLNFYPSDKARQISLNHRAIGLGMIGFQEALDRLQIPFESATSADFADWSMELISQGAIKASAELACERGAFPGYAESKWSLGILPGDTLARLSQERGSLVDVASDASQDWVAAREMVRRFGMRNSATTAISNLGIPATIAGVSPSIDSTLAEEEHDPRSAIECAARRQKWTDMGQTLTLETSEKDIEKLAALYMQAWEKGIKTMQHQFREPVATEEARMAPSAVMA